MTFCVKVTRASGVIGRSSNTKTDLEAVGVTTRVTLATPRNGPL